MSRYLEEAAAQLRKATAEFEQNCAESSIPGLAREALAEKRQRIARGFATLAAIENGLLPAEITQDVIAAVIARPPPDHPCTHCTLKGLIRMFPYLFSADSATKDRGVARASMTVEQQIVAAWSAARADGDRAEMDFLRLSARAIDPALVDELDGFGHPAAA